MRSCCCRLSIYIFSIYLLAILAARRRSPHIVWDIGVCSRAHGCRPVALSRNPPPSPIESVTQLHFLHTSFHQRHGPFGLAAMASTSAASTAEEPHAPPVATSILKQWAHSKAATIPKRIRGQQTVNWSNEEKKQWPTFKQFVPDSAMDLKPNWEKYNAHKSDTVVCFWDPPAFNSRYCSTPRCIVCGSDEVESNGWPTHTDNAGFIPIVKIGGCDWVYAKNYRHQNCKTKEGGTKTTNFNTVHPKYLEQLPEFVRARLPGIQKPVEYHPHYPVLSQAYEAYPPSSPSGYPELS